MLRYVLGILFTVGLGAQANAAVIPTADLSGLIGSQTGNTQAFVGPQDSSQFTFDILNNTPGPIRFDFVSPGALGQFGGGDYDFSVKLFKDGAIVPVVPGGNQTGADLFFTAGAVLAGMYTLQVTAFDILAPFNTFTSYDWVATVTPVPAAALLFGSALAGIGALRARRRNGAETTA